MSRREDFRDSIYLGLSFVAIFFGLALMQIWIESTRSINSDLLLGVSSIVVGLIVISRDW